MKLEGARWHEFVLIEMTPTGMLIEAPVEPPLQIGAIRDVEVEGRRGMAIVESAYTDLGRRKSYYTIKVVELDRGLLAAIERCTARDGPAIRVSEHDASNEA